LERIIFSTKRKWFASYLFRLPVFAVSKVRLRKILVVWKSPRPTIVNVASRDGKDTGKLLLVERE
jgi:hypothetical protein